MRNLVDELVRTRSDDQEVERIITQQGMPPLGSTEAAQQAE